MQQRREHLLKQIREQWKEPEREELRSKAAQPDSETLHSPAPNVSFEDSDPLPNCLKSITISQTQHDSKTTSFDGSIFMNRTTTTL